MPPRPWPAAIDRLAAGFVCAANTIIFMRTPRAGLADLLSQLACASPPFVFLALTLGLNERRYHQGRAILVPLLRLAYHLQRSERSPKASAAALMLGHGARSGLWGACVDTIRLLVGIRLLSNALITLLFPLPLAVAAVVHTAIIRLTVNNPGQPGYCSTELLSHPLTRQRLEMLAAVMHTASVAATPMGTSIARHSSYECVHILRWLQAVFTLVPIVLLAWWYGSPGADLGRNPQQQQRQHSLEHPQQLEQPQPPPPSQQPRVRRRQEARHHLWQQVDNGLHAACGCSLQRSVRCCALLWLLAVLWVMFAAT